ncbi:MAG: outer membrane protein assembly factor BamA, partial [Gammaproteobacteria bacterium]|nr:outer membrane protein assembly factor BamA [Gammaproteobacteria bacterium]
VSEGRVAKIKEINLVGNTVFEEEDLLELFQLTTPGLWTWATNTDQYSKQKLAADLETLRSYYLDRGYINFNIESTQVSITPDKQDVYITINVSEGEQFRVREVRLAGDLVVPDENLFQAVTVRQGGVFSRKDVTETSANITKLLGTEGYAFANVNAVPDINDQDKTVQLTFFVDPGKRVYVRRVNFKGNSKTRDEVLRREMRQVEGGWISTEAVERSKVRLDRLGYFEEVNVETPAVPGTPDQVDVDFNVKEAPSGSLLIGAGFSQGQGVIISSSVTQDNFLGTGHRVGLTFNNSKVNRNFGFSWIKPYFTLDGISLGLDAHLRKTDAADANISDYDLDQLGGSLTLGIPVTEFNSIDLGVGIESTQFDVGTNASREVLAFRDAAGDKFTTVSVNAAFANDSRNSKFFPTSGAFTRVAGEVAVPGLDLSFFKVDLQHQRFFPLFASLTGMLNLEVGYGDGLGNTENLPLYTNYYAGGIRSVRGFSANTLGPRDSNNEPLGGSLKVVGNAELIIPAPFLQDGKTLRLSGFFDAGNVYGPNEDFEISELRYSTGVAATWLSPFGPLTVSVAAPLEKQPRDETQIFQFTFGTSF